MAPPPERPALRDLLGDIWRRLAQSVAEPGNPLRIPALGTSDEDGSHTRTVVLRAAKASGRTVTAYTDSRSQKVKQIDCSPAVSWLFYDPESRTQTRLEGAASVHRDGALADEAWEQTSDANRRLYAVASPGTVEVGPVGELGRANFAAIRCVVDHIDWLDLSVRGHLRAQFEWRDGAWAGSWVAP